MIEFTLTRTDGKALNLIVPTSLKEVRLNQKIDFDVAFKDIVTFLSEKDEEGMPKWVGHRTYYLYLVARCISEFLGQDLNEIMACDVADLMDEHNMLYPHVIQKHIELYEQEDAVMSQDAKENVLVRLYEHIYCLLSSYKFTGKLGSDFTYTHKGVKYQVPRRYRKALLGDSSDVFFEKVPLIQSVECLEVIRWAYNKKQEGKDLDGSITFTEIIKTVATLSRQIDPTTKEAKLFPTDQKHIEKLIEEQTNHLIDLDVQTALDVFFCLTATSKNSEKWMGISGFLKVFQHDLEESLRSKN